MTRALLLSAYDAGSHARWHAGLTAHTPHVQWTTLTLPPRHFPWRARGNSYSFAFEHGDTLRQPFDLLVTTSMTDLSALRGLVPALGALPTLVYMHENQFAFPTSAHADTRNDVHLRLLNLYTALCADRLVFNSAYNRETFFSGARALLRKLPDHAPLAPLDALQGRAHITPVPLADSLFATPPHKQERTPHLLWNQRWEHDRAPERMFRALELLSRRGRAFRLHVVGQRFRSAPACFAEARETLSRHIETWGYVEDLAAYRALLRRAHIVLSTSLHEFQGLAVQEAIASGCLPALPDRLAYPEYTDAAHRYPSHPDDAEADARALADHLDRVFATRAWQTHRASASLRPWRWSVLAHTYHEHIQALTSP